MLGIIEDTFKISKSSIDAHRHERKPLTCAEITKLSLFYQREGYCYKQVSRQHHRSNRK